MQNQLIEDIEDMVFNYIDHHEGLIPEIWVPMPLYCQLTRELQPYYNGMRNSGYVQLNFYFFKRKSGHVVVALHGYKCPFIQLFPEGTLIKVRKKNEQKKEA